MLGSLYNHCECSPRLQLDLVQGKGAGKGGEERARSWKREGGYGKRGIRSTRSKNSGYGLAFY